MRVMRAKMVCNGVTQSKNTAGEVTSEQLRFNAVAKSTAYPADGSDEDNSFAKWSPSASLEIQVANPALFGKIAHGDKFYVDFTKAE